MHGVALKKNGSLVAWGRNDEGQCEVPDGNDFIAITAGAWHNLALKSDGSVIAWGWNEQGECNVPPGKYKAIEAGGFYSLALKQDGSLIGWGADQRRELGFEVPLPQGSDFVAIDCGTFYKLIVAKSSGEIISRSSSWEDEPMSGTKVALP
jgi:alpha-tubulin suppressor-like RCC1 family protein